MTVFSNMYTTLQFEKGYACTHISILVLFPDDFSLFNVDPLALSSHLYSESHSFDHCSLVHINGDDKVESVVKAKLLVILLALYLGSFPLQCKPAWVQGYYRTKSNSISIICL